MLFWNAFIIPVLNFFLQSYPRFFNKYFGVDVWTRLLEVEHIRNNNHKIPHKKIGGQFIIEGYFDYPPVFPLLLSYLPKTTLLQMQGFIAPFFDSLQVLFLYYAALFITDNHSLALLSQIIYMLTPMVAIENGSLTPRSLGYFNFTLATFPLVLFFHGGAQWLFIVGTIFAAFLFLTHRFALQSFFFLTLFFTFYLNSAVFIQSFLLGLLLALFLTGGYYIRVLKGHLYNIYFWIKNLDFRWAHQVRGLTPQKKQKSDWVTKIYRFMSAFSPLALFGLNPWSFSGFIVFIAIPFASFEISPVLNTLAVWIIFFYLFGVVVLKTKKLMPIGEGYRYMEMATVPSSILSAYLFYQFYYSAFRVYAFIILASIIAANLSIIVIIQIKGIINDKNRTATKDLLKVFNYINKGGAKISILCIPHQNTTMTIYHTRARVLVNADNQGLLKIQNVYPVLKKSVTELGREYGLSHVLIKKSYATLSDLGLSKKDVEMTNGDVIFAKLKG